MFYGTIRTGRGSYNVFGFELAFPGIHEQIVTVVRECFHIDGSGVKALQQMREAQPNNLRRATAYNILYYEVGVDDQASVQGDGRILR